MFKWFINPKVSVVEITEQALDDIEYYVAKADHTPLVNLFRRSVIDTEDQVQYLMPEIHIGSVLQKLVTTLTKMNIAIYSGKRPDNTASNTLYLNDKHITNVPTMINILVQVALTELGYSNDSNSHLPTMLGRFISESSKV